MSTPRWWANGLLVENCSCQLICPAHVSFKQRCASDLCVGHWTVHVTEASFGDTMITDRNVVVVFEAPVLMHDSGWVERLYIDERASESERVALESIFSGVAGGPWQTLGQFVATRLHTTFCPIHFEDGGDTKRITIPGIFDTTVVALRGRDRRGPAVLSNLYNVIHGMVHVLGYGNTSCHDAPFAIATERSHGLYSDFSWSVGEQP